MTGCSLGIDVGSTTVKVVALDPAGTVLTWRYLRSEGRPRQALLRLLDDLSQQMDISHSASVGLTGSGGEAIAALIGGRHVNELIAQTCAVGRLHPEARSVIEIGGQDSKFLSLDWDAATQQIVLKDFAMNALCAAGTGSFLDQQADRLGIDIQDEFARLALQAESPARIAGRCTVFAKSDMIHLQQQGTPLPEILAGLCLALARNFKSVVARGKPFTRPILFQGGVACNAGVVRAFESVLGLEPGQLIVPEYHLVMAALGTGLLAMQEARQGSQSLFKDLDLLRGNARMGSDDRKHLAPLAEAVLLERCQLTTQTAEPRQTPLPIWLGIDVGSVSTNLVAIDQYTRVLARRYLPTAGQPLEAVRQGLAEIGAELGESVSVEAAGVTGSGRYLIADFTGADIVRNEITAQARAAVAIDPEVDTVFEIGGQDSKYIRLDHGAVVDFVMNSACAAGTGSFLEEQANRLGIDVRTDFSQLALAAQAPLGLGERCTVFMESDLVHHQQCGATLDEITGGLAYAIAQNYLNRVVNGRPIGRTILFQGGVAGNHSVQAAFQLLTDRSIRVPLQYDVTGAIGVALLAQESNASDGHPTTKFKGFDLRRRRYESSTFLCQACPNLCEVNRVTVSGEPPMYYGARCERFEEAGRQRSTGTDVIPDLFAERNDLLIGDYQSPGRRSGRLRVAIPRALIFYDLFPYWRTLFGALDIELVVSSATSPTTISETMERAAVETCFPAKLMFGHVSELLNQDADFLFLPSVANRENIAPGQLDNNYCPYVPAMPYLVSAHLTSDPTQPQPLLVPLHFLWPKIKRAELHQLARRLGVSSREMDAADSTALRAQQDFYSALRRRGQEVLAALSEKQVVAVLVGRTYNTCDMGVCQDLPRKLRKLGVLPMPMDFLPIHDVDISDEYDNMYWRGGQAILAAARIIRDDPRLQAIYVTNFGCGPDSFLLSFFRKSLGSKPCLELEFDDHTADAGVITRCEAFFETLPGCCGASN